MCLFFRLNTSRCISEFNDPVPKTMAFHTIQSFAKIVLELKNEISARQNRLEHSLQSSLDKLTFDMNRIIKESELIKTLQESNMSVLLEENTQLRGKFDLLADKMSILEQFQRRNTNEIPVDCNFKEKVDAEVQTDNANRFRYERRMIGEPEQNASGNINWLNHRANSALSVSSKGKKYMDECKRSETRSKSSNANPSLIDKEKVVSVKAEEIMLKPKPRLSIKCDPITPAKKEFPTAVNTLEEYMLNKNFEETCLCIEEYTSSKEKKDFLKKMLYHALCSQSDNFHELGELLIVVLVKEIISSTLIQEIFNEFLADTITYKLWIDIPSIFQYFSQVIVPLIQSSKLCFVEVSEIFKPHREAAGQQIKQLVEIIIDQLTETCGHEWVKNRLMASNIQPSDFGFELQNISDRKTEQFIPFTSDNNIVSNSTAKISSPDSEKEEKISNKSQDFSQLRSPHPSPVSSYSNRFQTTKEPRPIQTAGASSSSIVEITTDERRNPNSGSWTNNRKVEQKPNNLNKSKDQQKAYVKVQCPICQQSFSQDKVESHAALCFQFPMETRSNNQDTTIEVTSTKNASSTKSNSVDVTDSDDE